MMASVDRPESDLFAAREWYERSPYLVERAWGSVRADYGESGDAWSSFPHDHARSRVFRWGPVEASWLKESVRVVHGSDRQRSEREIPTAPHSHEHIDAAGHPNSAVIAAESGRGPGGGARLPHHLVCGRHRRHVAGGSSGFDPCLRATRQRAPTRDRPRSRTRPGGFRDVVNPRGLAGASPPPVPRTRAAR